MAGTFSIYPPPLMKRLGVEMPSRNSYSDVSIGSPFSMIDALAVVPPMSNAIASACPFAWPSRAAPITPPAGPDPTAKTGMSLAVSTRIMPPDDATTRSGAVIPAADRFRVRLAR